MVYVNPLVRPYQINPINDDRRGIRVHRISGMDHLVNELKTKWTLEFNKPAATGKSLSVDNNDVLEITQSKTWLVSHRFEVLSLWKVGSPCLPKSNPIKNTNLSEKCTSVLDDYIVNGHAKPFPRIDEGMLKQAWDLTRHSLIHSKKSDKDSIVFD